MKTTDKSGERFLVFVRPALPLPEDADFEGTKRYLNWWRTEYHADAYELVEGGYVVVTDAASHDELRKLLDAVPLSKKRQARIEVFGLLPLRA